MIVYAVQHIPSGKFLPRPRGRGGSYVEPSDQIPRLFKKEGQAKTFLTYYLKGPWKRVFSSRGGFWGEEQYDYPAPSDKLTRNPEDYKIVKMRLE